MTTPTLYRASVEIGDFAGRTLSGLALPWDEPTRVRDVNGPEYLEAFAPASTDLTRSLHPDGFPTYWMHAYRYDPLAEPLGMVSYGRSAEGLMFELAMSRTRDADDKLELVKDGAARSVSVGFWPVRAMERTFPAGRTTYRTEVGLRELSLATTGLGQYPDAKVTAMRVGRPLDPTFDEIRDAVGDAIEKAVFGPDGAPAECYVYVQDITSEWVVYELEGSALDEARIGVWRSDYSIDDAGVVTLGDAELVTVAYVPVAAPASETRTRPPGREALRRKALLAGIVLPE